jgi:phenylalanyl-tRNA synthetase beta subunit
MCRAVCENYGGVRLRLGMTHPKRRVTSTPHKRNVEFFDVYQDSSLSFPSENTVNLGIRLEFQALNETLTSEYVENEILRLKTELETLCSVIFKD